MGWDMGHYFSKSCKVEQQYTLHSKQLRHTIKSFLSYIHPSFLIQRFQLVISVKVALPKVKRVQYGSQSHNKGSLLAYIIMEAGMYALARGWLVFVLQGEWK